jgi:lipoprotein-anchoring transpeptidase ErfK/SrfK
MMRLPALCVALIVALAACGGGEVVDAGSSVVGTPAATTTTSPPTPHLVEPAPDSRPIFSGLGVETLPEGMTLVAMIDTETDVYENPEDAEPTRTLPATTILGTATVVAIVKGPMDGWAKVMLPGRPNGSEGWIQTEDALVYVVEGQVVVDLSELKLTYYEQGEEVLTTPVAIGSNRNPTPTGQFFVTDNVTLADPNSPWGPHAFGISARSDTITEYRGGDGIIGIHGTSNSSSIGNAVSLGCVRVPNDVITRLHDMIPIGTPVEINA